MGAESVVSRAIQTAKVALGRLPLNESSGSRGGRGTQSMSRRWKVRR